MGKRAGRKLTREAKMQFRHKDGGQAPKVVKREILKGIEAGEPLNHIADRIRTKFPIRKDKALKMVMTEFDVMAKDWIVIEEPIHKNGVQNGL